MQYGPFDLKHVIEQLKPLQPEHIHTLGSTAEYRSLSELSMAGLATPLSLLYQMVRSVIKMTLRYVKWSP